MFNFILYFLAAFIITFCFFGFYQTQKPNFFIHFFLFFVLSISITVIRHLIISHGHIVNYPLFFIEICFATLYSATAAALLYKAKIIKDMFIRTLMGSKWVVVRVKHSFERPTQNK